MDCRQAGQLLSCHLDDMLSREESRLLAQHLEGCGSCRRRLDSLRATVRALGSLPEVEPPPGFRAQWQQALAQHRPAAAQPARRYTAGGHPAWLARLGRSANSGWGRGLIAACLLVAVGLGFWTAGVGPTDPYVAVIDGQPGDSPPATEPAPAVAPGGNPAVIPGSGGNGATNYHEIAAGEPPTTALPGDTPDNEVAKPPAASPPGGQPGDAPPVLEPRLVSIATLGIKVDSYEEAIQQIYRIADRNGKYSVSLKTGGSEGISSISQGLTLRVPRERFSEVVAELAAVGIVTAQSSDTEDLASEYYNAQQRLEKLEARQPTLSGDALEKNKAEINSLETYLAHLEQTTNTGVIRIYLYLNNSMAP